MSTRPPGMPDNPDPNDGLVRALAELEVHLRKIAHDQESIKGEFRKLSPRIDTLTAEVRETARLVHHQARVIEVLSNETSDLVQTRVAFSAALDEFKTLMSARALELERTQKVFELGLELVEGRMRRVSDDVADLVAAARRDETSGLIEKPKL